MFECTTKAKYKSKEDAKALVESKNVKTKLSQHFVKAIIGFLTSA